MRKQRAQASYTAALTEEELLARLEQRFKPPGGGHNVSTPKLAAALVLARDDSLVPGTFVGDVGLPEGSRTRVQKYRDTIRTENLHGAAADTSPVVAAVVEPVATVASTPPAALAECSTPTLPSIQRQRSRDDDALIDALRRRFQDESGKQHIGRGHIAAALEFARDPAPKPRRTVAWWESFDVPPGGARTRSANETMRHASELC